MKLVFATHNMNKFQEVRKLIESDMEILSLDDISYYANIDENGLSLKENALIKASAVYSECKLPCFADDTGLLVPCLNGDPGVRSARYAGDDCDSERNIELLLDNMKDCADRSASFQTVICFKTGDNHKFFVGETKGMITKKRRGEGGFGYDPVFMPENSNKTFGEMTLDEKNKISHRYKAVNALNKYLMNFYNISFTRN